MSKYGDIIVFNELVLKKKKTKNKKQKKKKKTKTKNKKQKTSIGKWLPKYLSNKIYNMFI